MADFWAKSQAQLLEHFWAVKLAQEDKPNKKLKPQKKQLNKPKKKCKKPLKLVNKQAKTKLAIC